METDNCPMCWYPQGSRITRKLGLGQMTYKDAARRFNMEVADVEEHVYKHSADAWQPADAMSKSYDRDYYVKRLESMHDDLSAWADEILEREPTAENIRAATSLVKELRDTLRLLGEVTKILKDDESQQAITAVKEMQMRYLALTNIIITQSCPTCKEKILQAIEDQRKLLQ